jgi:hypothetical protein
VATSLVWVARETPARAGGRSLGPRRLRACACMLAGWRSRVAQSRRSSQLNMQARFLWNAAMLMGCGAPPPAVAHDTTPPAAVCPSSIVANSSFIPRPPLATVTGAQVATTEDCIALCCNTANCTEWIHTTEFKVETDATAAVASTREQRAEQRPGACVAGEPCCLLHSCLSDGDKGCHHNHSPREANITSGRPVPFKLQFAGVFSSNMVLQRAPASARIYGMAYPGKQIQLRVVSESGPAGPSPPPLQFAAHASINGSWSVQLPPRPAGGNFSFYLSCPTCKDPSAAASMTSVTYGEVWICSGQSNSEYCPTPHAICASICARNPVRSALSHAAAPGHRRLAVVVVSALRVSYGAELLRDAVWLPLHHTFGLNDTLASIAAGELEGPHGPRIRMFTMPKSSLPSPAYVIPQSHTGGKGMSGDLNMWNVPSSRRPTNSTTGVPIHTYGNCDDNVMAPYCFSATCWDFAVSLMNETEPEVPLGMISSNVGGTTIQAWSAKEQLLASCQQVSDPETDTSYYGGLYNGMIAPLVNMSVRGFIWYQGENSIGRFPEGSTTNHSGYSCEAANLVDNWRSAFSRAPNGTDPEAPFGLVTLAAGTSEGHGAEMAAFRQAQMGACVRSFVQL